MSGQVASLALSCARHLLLACGDSLLRCDLQSLPVIG
jgi:hypothetical protein